MKRFFSTILAVLYLAFSAGATMHLHYCMGEFVDISLVDTNSGACGKCGMESHDLNNECCRDIPVTIKITDDQLSRSFDHTLGRGCIQIEALFPPLLTYIPFLHNRPSITLYPYHSPPGNRTYLFLKNKNLRI